MNQQRRESVFVTVVAWVSIACAAFAMFTFAFQVIMMWLVLFSEGVDVAMTPEDATLLQLLSLAFVAISGLALISAIGLLLRKNWARLLFMLLLVLAMAVHVYGIATQFTLLSGVADVPDSELSAEFSLMFNLTRAFTVALCAAFCLLFGWVFAKLASVPIRTEFVRTSVCDAEIIEAVVEPPDLPPPSTC